MYLGRSHGYRPPGRTAYVTEANASAEQTRQATLSRELSEFLVELSIGVHRYAMYPEDHPSLTPVVENIIGRLAELFEDRQTLSIGVAQRQLIIEGVATDVRHPVMADLARRLHDHQLGAVSFTKGAQAREIEHLLRTLAQESERGGTPLGLRPPEEFPEWEHVRLYRVGYEQLEMLGSAGEGVGGGMDRAGQLWLGLAQAALATDEIPAGPPDAGVVAESIEGHAREDAYDQVIVGYLLQLADELKGQGREAAKVQERVSQLVRDLDSETLTRLVDMGGSWAQRKRFLLDANQSLAVDSVVKILQAAASATEQSISTSLTRLLSKLAMHATQGTDRVRSQADTALRENVEALISDWELKDPNPEAYTAVLDAMARAAPVFETPAMRESISGPERIVRMAIEVDAYGPTVAKAIMDMMEESRVSDLFDLVQEAPAENVVAARIRKHLTNPTEFRRIIAAGELNDQALTSLIQSMGAAAVDPLLDVLADSDSRSVRRRVFDALAHMGPFVGQRAVERLADGRWFVLRNMLALLQRLPHVPEDFDPQPYVEHADARVRREAFPLALRRPGRRERALAGALADGDERMVRMALLEMSDGPPEALVPTLVNRVVLAPQRSDEIRSLGAKVLRSSTSPLALKALTEIATDSTAILGRIKLAQKSSAMLSALEALAATWWSDSGVRKVLHMAERSRDPDIRGAVRHGAMHRTSKEDTA